jgi:hypothetical protein
MQAVAPASGFNAAMAAQPSMAASAISATSVSDTDGDGDGDENITINITGPATIVDLSDDALLALDLGLFGVGDNDFDDAFLIADFFENQLFVEGAVTAATTTLNDPTIAAAEESSFTPIMTAALSTPFGGGSGVSTT